MERLNPRRKGRERGISWSKSGYAALVRILYLNYTSNWMYWSSHSPTPSRTNSSRSVRLPRMGGIEFMPHICRNSILVSSINYWPGGGGRTMRAKIYNEPF